MPAHTTGVVPMIRRILILFLAGLLVLALASPVLAAGSGDSGGGSGGGTDSSGSPSGGNGNDGSSPDDRSGSGSSPGDTGRDWDQSGEPGGTPGPTATGTREPTAVPTGVPLRSEDRERSAQEENEQPGVQIQDRDLIQGRTNDEFFRQIGEKEQELLQDRDLEQLQDRDRDQLNRTLALYTFSIAGNVSGDSGPELVRLAAQVNQSLENAIRAEEQIQERSAFTRMLFGGDPDAAGILLRTAEQNREQIRLMEQLIQNCSACDPRVQEQLMEQIRSLEQEQNRITVLGGQELDDKGLLGWLFR